MVPSSVMFTANAFPLIKFHNYAGDTSSDNTYNIIFKSSANAYSGSPNPLF